MMNERRAFARFAGIAAVLFGTAGVLPARTIALTAEDCDEMAAISSLAPRLSWVMWYSEGVFQTQPIFYWQSKITLLMRFPIQDFIPKGQRITKAELSIHTNYVAGG